MPITRTPWIDDDGTGTTGTIINNAEKTLLYNQIDAQLPVFQPVPFSAADFAGVAPLVWTVDATAVLESRYAVINGTLMVWSFYVAWWTGVNVLSGAPADRVRIRIPGGKIAASNTMLAIDFVGGVAGVPPVAGLYGVPLGDGWLSITKPSGNYALTDVMGLVTTLVFEVQ